MHSTATLSAAMKSVEAMASFEGTGVPWTGPLPSIPSWPSITARPQYGCIACAVTTML